MKLRKQDQMICPHCSSELEGEVGDYVVNGELGEDTYAEEECVECYELFYTKLVEGGMVDIWSYDPCLFEDY